jgi:maleylacetoacetate isomerase
VPALRTDDGELLIQSPAIIEYLEERYPQRRCCRKTSRPAPMCVAWRR